MAREPLSLEELVALARREHVIEIQQGELKVVLAPSSWIVDRPAPTRRPKDDELDADVKPGPKRPPPRTKGRQIGGRHADDDVFFASGAGDAEIAARAMSPGILPREPKGKGK